MATVKWNDLPALSQHHDFFGAVCSILDHARVLEALYDQPTTFDSPRSRSIVVERAASVIRSYYPSDLQISEQPSSLDDVNTGQGMFLTVKPLNMWPTKHHGLYGMPSLLSTASCRNFGIS
jgi:hypothetical protein